MFCAIRYKFSIFDRNFNSSYPLYLPLARGLTGPELAELLSDAEPGLVVCRPGSEALFEELAAGSASVLTLGAAGAGSLVERSRALPDDPPTAEVAADDLAALLYTSGTTGRPKGAMLTHDNLASNAMTLTEAWGFRADDVLLNPLPLHHVHGLFVACHCALAAGARMILLPRFDADEVIRLLPEVTAMMGVPTFYVRLLRREGLDAERCAGVRLFTSGSAPLPPEVFHRCARRAGHQILERYGMTETLITFSNPLEGERRPGTVGTLLPGFEARIVDGADRGGLAPGEVGELEIRGDSPFRGYWRRPEQTAAAFHRLEGEGGEAARFFVTGDLASIDADGYLTLVGRSRDLIITGGENVYPREVEAILDGLGGVAESAVIGLPDEDLGEAVTAAVVAADPAAPPDVEALRSRLKERLAGFKVPRRIFLVGELPRNAMGKVQKERLRRELRADP